ncbi:amino acid ABC transporter permease [Cytobacillus sp. IB215316]|uniref:amino acid ABC transporter permease n=1 Tax=Cytobacillus sp. IB215316 TaxID=3097354 RepID=UPI002A1034C7|nr:amino acid ABC transporter permease [Cytobacillus sp. IB215316]MDX8359672.1 amino acid ABC transporter permease [Cytobacillus sp. IB215316]
MNLDFGQIVPSMPFILKGIIVTIQIVISSAIIGFLLGIIISLFKIGRIKVLVLLADVYTSIFRGTPLILQIVIIYYGLPEIIGVEIGQMPAAIIAFSLNSAAYISEIIRAGILAVDKGQKEAAQALGVPYSKMMLDIVLPQALKNILPALMNEFITLTKESALVMTIGIMDIMRSAFVVGGDLYSFLEPLLFAAGIYYVMVMILTLLGKAIERRMRKSD